MSFDIKSMRVLHLVIVTVPIAKLLKNSIVNGLFTSKYTFVCFYMLLYFVDFSRLSGSETVVDH